MKKKDIGSYEYTTLQEEMLRFGEKSFRAGQIYEWLHKKLAVSFSEMTNLSLDLRKRLEATYEIAPVILADRQVSRKDGVTKFLFQLGDECMVESVWMPYHYGNSVCISSQVGCRMGCRFCASAIGGFTRNLAPSEMLGQVYAMQRLMNQRVSHVVVMGTGEPLDNYHALLRFIHMLTDEHGLHISQRNVTVSTCGLAPQITQLAKERLQITLALSLHQADQRKREQLMPIAKKYHLAEVLQACQVYFEKTGRRVTFEYSLIAGLNDREEDAALLKTLFGGKNCHLNLIPINSVREKKFCPPNRENAEKFKNKLEKSGINVTIRREMGADIDGACGQLRQRHRKG